jgi:hypothetical protein
VKSATGKVASLKMEDDEVDELKHRRATNPRARRIEAKR